ncbi:MAG: hypothetical protein HUJ25_13025, partial [Crocinitomicaceae bacterium]|nr:hypothetical protein [Crocinitomicaceae bacterium]
MRSSIQNKALAIVHMLILLALIFWNYYSNTGVIDGNTVGSVSKEFDSLFTPAGYTFGIWALIYMGLLYYVIIFYYFCF